MTPRGRRIEALYREMQACPPEMRAEALAKACEGDESLRDDVQSLLDRPESAAELLDGHAMGLARQPAALSTSLFTGRRLGTFEIQELLGSGGMGDVYKARDTRLGRTVAIKILPRAFRDDSERSTRFQREAQVLASLNHQHICTLYDQGRDDGIDFLVMEFLEGQTLAERLRKGSLPLNEALTCAIQIADALDAAHRHGVVHRDLKPANIILTKGGAKVLDFGLAKLRVDDHTSASDVTTLTGQIRILGTLPYMAPEQLEGRRVDARADLFAMGAVLYEMLT